MNPLGLNLKTKYADRTHGHTLLRTTTIPVAVRNKRETGVCVRLGFSFFKKNFYRAS